MARLLLNDRQTLGSGMAAVVHSPQVTGSGTRIISGSETDPSNSRGKDPIKRSARLLLALGLIDRAYSKSIVNLTIIDCNISAIGIVTIPDGIINVPGPQPMSLSPEVATLVLCDVDLKGSTTYGGRTSASMAKGVAPSVIESARGGVNIYYKRQDGAFASVVIQHLDPIATDLMPSKGLPDNILCSIKGKDSVTLLGEANPWLGDEYGLNIRISSQLANKNGRTTEIWEGLSLLPALARSY